MQVYLSIDGLQNCFQVMPACCETIVYMFSETEGSEICHRGLVSPSHTCIESTMHAVVPRLMHV